MSDKIRSLLREPRLNREALEQDLHSPFSQVPPHVPDRQSDYVAMRMMHEAARSSGTDGRTGLVHRDLEKPPRRDMPTGMSAFIKKYGHLYID